MAAIGDVSVAVVARRAVAEVATIMSVSSGVGTEAVAAAALRRGPVAVTRAVADGPVQHGGNKRPREAVGQRVEADLGAHNAQENRPAVTPRLVELADLEPIGREAYNDACLAAPYAGAAASVVDDGVRKLWAEL